MPPIPPPLPGLPGAATGLARIARAKILALALLAFSALPGRAPSAQAIERPVVLSVYQGTPREGDFPANLALARATIERARERGSQFLVFPECFLSGYESRAAVSQGARGLDDPDLAGFVAETASHDLVVLVGMARREGARIYDSVLVIQSGRILGTYDKVVLTADDRNVLGFSAGTALPVFAAHGVRFAALICADSSYAQPGLLAALQGAELLFTPHYDEIAQPMVDDHRRWVRNCHVGMATLLRVAVAHAGTVKSSRPGQVGYGGSFILGPQGEPLAEARLLRAELITATLEPDAFRPPHVWSGAADTPAWLRSQVGLLFSNFRPPRGDGDLRFWLENMLVDHRFTTVETAEATGLTAVEVAAEARRLGVAVQRPQPPDPGAPLKIRPYPGGRHPRLGFFEGAVAPQRETKVSVFAPWDGGGYAVVDVPEAIFSNLGLLYLAHTHVPTLWDPRGIRLPSLEWERHPDGRLSAHRILPNGVSFRARAEPRRDGVRFTLELRNGTSEPLSELRVQNCVMLGRTDGFAASGDDRRVSDPPLAAARSADGRHWVITGWERCQRVWGNPAVPCLHADPVLPDCPPGATVGVAGWLSFFAGEDVGPELTRLKAAAPWTVESGGAEPSSTGNGATPEVGPPQPDAGR